MFGRIRSSRGSRQSGQTLAEFALAIPLLMLLAMALLELALAFNAFMGLNRASQYAAHLAAITGNQIGADCLILTEIEGDVSAPNRKSAIRQVSIQRTSLAGNVPFQQQVWDRSGTTVCTLPDNSTVAIPYTLTTNGYPEDQRCPVLKGCPSMDPPRSTVDNIGVAIQYRHDWVTPLSVAMDFLPGGQNGWIFTQRNIFRIEPTL